MSAAKPTVTMSGDQFAEMHLESIRLRGRVSALLEANNAEVEMRRALVSAGRDLYFAGRWSAGLPVTVEARLWEALRDALGFAPGAATAAGIGSDAISIGPLIEDDGFITVVGLSKS